jgi:hypothetical protein
MTSMDAPSRIVANKKPRVKMTKSQESSQESSTASLVKMAPLPPDKQRLNADIKRAEDNAVSMAVSDAFQKEYSCDVWRAYSFCEWSEWGE